MANSIENAPRLNIDEVLHGKDGKPSANGILERRIVWNLLKHLKAAGFHPTKVFDGEVMERAETATDVMELVFNLDEASVRFKNDDEGALVHGVVLVLGNGVDVVSDWGFSRDDADGFNAAMDSFSAEDFA